MWNLLHLRGRESSSLAAAVLLCGAGSVGAQSSTPVGGSSGTASVEVLCRLEMPAVCIVRDVQPVIEVRNEAGNWLPVQPDREPVTIVSAHAVSNSHAERVVFRIRAPDHLAALQLVQFEVLPTVPR